MEKSHKNTTLHLERTEYRKRYAVSRDTVTRILIVGALVVSLFKYWTFQSTQAPQAARSVDVYADSDYPLRPAREPWDISVNATYPKRLKRSVREGTWLRIAVHPSRDEIVFDMLGDLYCMTTSSRPALRKARAFLAGIPFDKEAEFSSDGSKIAFISDAGFGVDNIWTIPYTTCDEMVSRAQAGNIRPTAIQQTNSTFRFYSSPAFHPTEPKIVATKWFLTGRPNGAGEIWEIPEHKSVPGTLPEHVGDRLVSRKLPAGWPQSRYFESQLGAEQARYHPDGSAVVFTRNTNDDATGKFSYNKDVHAGINSVFMLNTSTSQTTGLVVSSASSPNKPASPGGASMPRLSPDGQTLAFVRRVDDKSVLALKDMRSGTVHYAWDGLTFDVSMIPAFMGAYPNYGFTAKGSAIIIWAEGQIWRIPLRYNSLGERIAGGPPLQLSFEAEIDLELGETRYNEQHILSTEVSARHEITSMASLTSDFRGEKVAFEAAGDNYVVHLESEEVKKVGKPDEDTNCYSPSFITDTVSLIQACWSDRNFTTFYLVEGNSLNDVIQITGIPKGRYISPVVVGTTIAFVRTGADYMTGAFEETLGQGVWIGKLSRKESEASVRDIRLFDGVTGTQDTRLSLRQAAGTIELLIHNPDSVTLYDVSSGKPTLIATGKASVEMTSSGGGHHGSSDIAFRDFQHVWLAPLDTESPMLGVWSKPGDPSSPAGLVRLSTHGGHDVAFSGDGEHIFWLFGPTIFHAEVDDIERECHGASMQARDNGQCSRSVISTLTLNITSPSALGQHIAESEDIPLAFVNASLISMASDPPQLMENATIVVHHGVFTQVGPGRSASLPSNARVFDVGGGVVLPGFIDIHGHWGGFLSNYPIKSWEMEIFLAYGVTTIHNPASKNVAGMSERNRIEKGRMWGPRVFHTGDVLYGSTQPSVYTEINSLEDARDALLRVKVEGGNSSLSVKNYQLVARSARQRLLQEARNLGMHVVPEGGWSLDWDLTYFIDGYTTLEHPVPIPSLYDDVLSVIAASGSSYTPLAVMNYGGIFGQHWIHQSTHLPSNQKLRRFLPHAILESLTEVKQAPNSSYQFFNTTISTRKLKERGVRTNVGAHGEQPIGYLFHSEMDMMMLGGQSAYEVLYSASMGNAISMGLSESLGSVEVGKLADLVVYPPEVASLDAAWEFKRDMKWVVSRGKVLSVDNDHGLVEVWPIKGRIQDLGRRNAEDG